MQFGNNSINEFGFGGYGSGKPMYVYSPLLSGVSYAYMKTDGLWTTSSDSTVKHDIKPLVYGLNDVMQMNPVNFKWNNSNDSTIGFIGQEMQKIVPEVVDTFKGKYSISYSSFAPVLVKAIQEQNSIIIKHQNTIDSMRKHQNITDSLLQINNNLLSQLLYCCTSDTTHGHNGHGNGQRIMQNEVQNNSINIHDLELANNAVLYTNIPNPFDQSTTIKYFVPENSEAQIIFYDEFGNKINELNVTERGMGQINISASNLAAGMYSYSLIVNGKLIDTKKMIKL